MATNNETQYADKAVPQSEYNNDLTSWANAVQGGKTFSVEGVSVEALGHGSFKFNGNDYPNLVSTTQAVCEATNCGKGATKLALEMMNNDISSDGQVVNTNNSPSLIGEIAAVVGTVMVTKANGDKVALQVGDKLYLGDVIDTVGSNSSVKIAFSNGKMVKLGGDSHIVLDESVVTSEQFASSDVSTDSDIAELQKKLLAGEEIEEEATAAGEEDGANNTNTVLSSNFDEATTNFARATLTEVSGNINNETAPRVAPLDLIDDPVQAPAIPGTASITLDGNITSDDIINANEAGQNIAITGIVGGDATVGDTVTLSVNGNTYTGTVAANNTFSVPVAGNDLVADADKTIQASVTTANATATDTETYSVDTDIVATITLDENITSDDIIQATEAGQDIAITGTTGADVQPGDTVTLVVNGNTYTGTVAANNTFSINVAGSDLAADANRTIDASVTTSDAAGNSATATDTETYSVDTTLPTITINEISDDVINAAESNQDLTLSGTTTNVEDGQVVTISFNGQDYTATVNNNTFSTTVPAIDVQALPEGNIVATANVSNQAGNSASDTEDVNIDTIAPNTPSVDLPDDQDTGVSNSDDLTNKTTPNIDIDLPAGLEVGNVVKLYNENDEVIGEKTLTNDDINAGKVTIPVDPNTPLHEGDNPIQATVTDNAGNESPKSTPLVVTVDTQVEAEITLDQNITPDDIINATEAGQNINITGTTGPDVQPGDTVTLTVNGNTYTGAVAANNTFSIPVAGSDLADDADQIIDASVTTTDNAGNTASDTDTEAYSVDTTEPTITLDEISDDVINASEKDQPLTISGTTINVEDGQIVTISFNGQDYNATVQPDGTFSTTVPATDVQNLPEGNIVATATVTNQAGNTGSDTEDVNVNTATQLTDGNEDATTQEDTPITNGDLFADLTDPDSTSHSITEFKIDTNNDGTLETFNAGDTANITNVGTLLVNANGTYTFTPAANFHGSVPTATYTIVDNNDPSDTDTSTLDITVTADTDSLIDGNEDTTTQEDISITNGDLFANLTDSDSTSHSVTEFKIDTNNDGLIETFNAGDTANIINVGTLLVNSDGTYTFTPEANFNGTVPTATYTIVDNNDANDTDTSTLDITVTATTDNLVDGNEDAATQEDTPITNGDLFTNLTDADSTSHSITEFTIDGTTYSADQTANITNVGTLLVNSDGTYTFTPEANFNGTVPTTTYTIVDNNDANDTDVSTLNITVNPVEDPTDAIDDNTTTNEDTSVDIDVLANDTDPDAGSKSPVTSVENGTHGTTTINPDGTVKYTPDANWNGTDTFTYTNADGDTATVTVVVNPVEDPTDAIDDTSSLVGAGNDNVDIDVLANDTDPDGSKSPVTSTTNGTHGTTTINPDGTVKYTLNEDYEGTDSFTYTNADGDTATVNLTIDTKNSATIDLATSSDTGSSGTDNVTKDNTPTLQGKTDPNSTVAIYAGATLLATVTADANGDWSYTTSTLNDGTHTFKVISTDPSGNEATSSNIDVTVDTSVDADAFSYRSGGCDYVGVASNEAVAYTSNYGDGSLAAGENKILGQKDGRGDIQVTFTDVAGNTKGATAAPSSQTPEYENDSYEYDGGNINIDAGRGVDTLTIAKDIELDFNQVDTLKSVEEIKLEQNADIKNLNADSLLDLNQGDDAQSIKIFGDDTNSVELDANIADTGHDTTDESGNTYDVYQTNVNGKDVYLEIDQDIDVDTI
jgi:VCBS repeat-containing protein